MGYFSQISKVSLKKMTEEEFKHFKVLTHIET